MLMTMDSSDQWRPNRACGWSVVQQPLLPTGRGRRPGTAHRCYQ
ncbi:hypothetical protein BS78_01G290800 [Paspalum vaginatum]|nr:hypothetical protein BS78_01G290800 [Paspalum vaginatum]